MRILHLSYLILVNLVIMVISSWSLSGHQTVTKRSPSGHQAITNWSPTGHQVVAETTQVIMGDRVPFQSVTNIFEYSNILVIDIYSDIRSYQFFFYEYIRTFIRIKFVCTNIFGHSFVSVLECKNYTNIRIYSNIHTIFKTNTYSGIHSGQIC